VLPVASRWWQIESRYRFNAKFGRTGQPRFICYPNAHGLPRIASVALQAEAFTAWPRPSLRLTRRPVGDGPGPVEVR
jgi:lysyl-tRNA synthetase class 2